MRHVFFGDDIYVILTHGDHFVPISVDFPANGRFLTLGGDVLAGIVVRCANSLGSVVGQRHRTFIDIDTCQADGGLFVCS